uniref:Uncharacterized protein n=1 Tax=Tetranychus urticae TaxID=32264 RepID=T1KBH5_TETUR
MTTHNCTIQIFINDNLNMINNLLGNWKHTFHGFAWNFAAMIKELIE